MDSIETIKDDLLKGGLAICLPRQNRGKGKGDRPQDDHPTPYPPFLRAGDQPEGWWWVLTPAARFIRNDFPVLVVCQVCEPPTRKRALSPFQGDAKLCPSLEGKGDRPNGRWMGSYPDPASNTVFKRQRGVRIPYPLLLFCPEKWMVLIV